jgi:hypothetical protein
VRVDPSSERTSSDTAVEPVRPERSEAEPAPARSRDRDALEPAPARNRDRDALGPARSRSPRGARPASANFSEEGISYQVRKVSAGDLANVESTAQRVDDPALAPRAVDSAAASSADTATGGWDGPVDEAFVNVGRDDGVRTSDLHEALSNAGISHEDTAYVRIRQRHTFIGVRQGLLDRVVSGLNGQTIAQRAVEAQPARPRQARR